MPLDSLKSQMQETRKSMMPSCQEELCETHLGYPKWPEEMTLFLSLVKEDGITPKNGG